MGSICVCRTSEEPTPQPTSPLQPHSAQTSESREREREKLSRPQLKRVYITLVMLWCFGALSLHTCCIWYQAPRGECGPRRALQSHRWSFHRSSPSRSLLEVWSTSMSRLQHVRTCKNTQNQQFNSSPPHCTPTFPSKQETTVQWVEWSDSGSSFGGLSSWKGKGKGEGKQLTSVCADFCKSNLAGAC